MLWPGSQPARYRRSVLKLVLPKGSLEKATLELFAAADLQVNRSSTVDYKASIDDPRIESVRILPHGNEARHDPMAYGDVTAQAVSDFSSDRECE